MRLLGFKRPKPTHRDLFLDRYQTITGWARGLTKNDPDLVEDVVQDAYIQFTLNGPDLDTIENLDGYLYVLVKNLCLTNYRRISRNRLDQLSVYEYDSAEFAIGKVDYRDLESARDDLQKLAYFLVRRKPTARSASIFILRFIHGYFPSEISVVLGSSRASIDVRLMEARKEIKAHLEEPDNFRFQPDDDLSRRLFQVLPVQSHADQGEFLLLLRSAIFELADGTHFGSKDLNRYRQPEGPRFKAGELSHLVSCRNCLDQVNKFLQLPGLKERFPTDTIGRDQSPAGSRDKNRSGKDMGDDNVVDIRAKS